jgi:Phage stabilisation protein
MRFTGFIGPSYTLQSVNVDCQRCINLYPEMDEEGTGNEGEVASLVSTPGLRLLATLPTGPVRGVFCDSTGQLWAAGGNALYQISSLWGASFVGFLNTSEGPVNFEDNGSQLIAVDGPCGYTWTFGLSATKVPGGFTTTVTSAVALVLTAGSTYQQFFSGSIAQPVTLPDVSTLFQGQGFNFVNLSSAVISVQTSGLNALTTMAPNTQLTLSCVSTTSGSGTVSWITSSTPAQSNTFGQITDPNFPGATHVSFMDSYFIFNKPGSQQFYLSPLNAVTPFNGLDIGSAEAAPDALVGLIELQELIYLFSQKHIEAFYDSGNNSFPFQRVSGAVIEIGCAAAYSIAKIGNAIYWLGQDKNGRGTVYSMTGMVPQRISTYAIESEIAGLGDVSGARSFVYQQAGHAFFCLNLPGANTTWVFDTSTNLWHERAYLSAGLYQRGLPDCHAFAYNTNVVGDYSSGKLYALDQTVFTDNGNPICRERAAPHISKDLNRIFHNAFQLDIEAGVGTSGTGQGVTPSVILQWSNDAGHSWSNEHWAGIGAIGKRKARSIWRRLGQARDRVYRVRITDPVKVTLLGAEIDMEEGAS